MKRSIETLSSSSCAHLAGGAGGGSGFGVCGARTVWLAVVQAASTAGFGPQEPGKRAHGSSERGRQPSVAPHGGLVCPHGPAEPVRGSSGPGGRSFFARTGRRNVRGEPERKRRRFAGESQAKSAAGRVCGARTPPRRAVLPELQFSGGRKAAFPCHRPPSRSPGADAANSLSNSSRRLFITTTTVLPSWPTKSAGDFLSGRSQRSAKGKPPLAQASGVF